MPVNDPVESGQPAVRCRNLSVTFNTPGTHLDVLSDVSLEVHRRETVAVVGPSGCGKSTLLRCILGLVAPTTGEISIFDGPPNAARKDGLFGIALQEPTLVEWLTIEENLRLPLQLRSTRRKSVDNAEVGKLLALTGLTDFARYKPHALSGGMRQRVSLARALVASPEFVLLDEPLGSLDLLTRTRLAVEIHQWLQERGVAAILVTHSVEEAVYLGTRVMVMSPRPGRIIEATCVPQWPERGEHLFETPTFLAEVARLRHILVQAWQR